MLDELSICYVYQDQYPWDVRVEKFCRSLSKKCKKINIVSRNRDDLNKSEEISKIIEINRLHHAKSKIINNIINMPAFFSPFWIIKILNVVKKNNSNVILVRDLPLALACVFVGRVLNIPVFMDMAENYPAMISDTWKYGKISKIDYFVRNPAFLKILEKIIFKYIDLVFVVSIHSKNRVVKEGLNKDKVVIVGNTPTVDSLIFNIDNNCKLIRSLSSLNFLYVGGLEDSRGLDTAIQALKLIKKKRDDCALIIIGEGTSKSRLQGIAKSIGVDASVHFLGWKPHEEIGSIILSSDICLIPHYVTEHTNTTIPNKIYDYMLYKKPVLSTNCNSLVEIIDNYNCGLVYKSADFNSFSEQAEKMFDPNVRLQMGLSGHNAVIKELNWAADEARLLSSMAQIKT